MLWFVLGIILVVGGLVWIFMGPSYENRTHEKLSLRWVGWVTCVLGLLLIFLSCITVVGARNIGVENFYGATTGRNIDAGPAFKAPWNGVNDIDATIQVEEYKTSDPILVKIGDQGEAKVALAYRWRINPDGADTIYKDYRNAEDITGAVRSALVSSNIKASLNEELGTYNPLQNIVITDDMTPEQIAKVTIPPIPYKELNDAVKANLEGKIADLGDLIDIESVTITYIQLPDGTQSKINDFNAKIQESKNTLIDIAIKKAQSRANEELSKSVDDSPNVLVSKCLDGLLDGSITNEPGFSCWPGGGSAVVVPQK